MMFAIDAAFCAVAVVSMLWTRRIAYRLAAGQRELDEKTQELTRRTALGTQIETRYRALFESVPVAIIVSRLDGSLIDINRAGAEIFGYASREEIMSLNMRSLYVNPAERDRRIAVALADDRAKPREFLMRRKDGTTFSALMQNQVIRDGDGAPSHIEGFITDISDYKRLEKDRQTLEHEQRISARMQSVGALAAGIAHEINTPMQFVSDSVYFLKTAVGELDVLWPELALLSKAASQQEAGSRGADPRAEDRRRAEPGEAEPRRADPDGGRSGPAGSADAADTSQTLLRIEAALANLDIQQLVIDANESAERALEGIRRVTKIIRAMREFAHPDNGEHTRVDINNAIETTLTVCKNVYKEIADVETDFGPLPPVLCQYGEINQVFLNIVVNAAHAIEEKNPDGAKGSIRISTAVEDEWAVIRIEDDGTGIPDSVKARIFDPFFTTKEVGKGTGQGLAIVQSVIVARHRGRITVDSEVGKGTTFVLRLPLEDRTVEVNGVANEQEA